MDKAGYAAFEGRLCIEFAEDCRQACLGSWRVPEDGFLVLVCRMGLNLLRSLGRLGYWRCCMASDRNMGIGVDVYVRRIAGSTYGRNSPPSFIMR